MLAAFCQQIFSSPFVCTALVCTLYDSSASIIIVFPNIVYMNNNVHRALLCAYTYIRITEK